MDAPDVLDLWDLRVRHQPDAPALVTPDRVLTHRSVDRLTDAWAASLAGRGAGPGRLVGLAFADPGRTVLGMLAALKAGAGFTVLDDRLPAAARDSLVRRTEAAVWLGDGAHAPAAAYVPDGAAGGAATGEGAGAADAGGHPVRPPARAAGHDVAYVLFTSGSTGQPKGTLIERDSLRRFAAAVAERLELAAGDRWLQVASLGFDVLIEEVFPALVAGAAVVCRADTRALDAEELHTMIARTGTTVVELSTQYWLEYARWLDARGLTTPAGLRLVVVGGERMDPRPYRDWQARQPARLAHVYGLTECTVSSTFYTGLLPADAREVPLGTPLRDVEISVRRDGRPVPQGEWGRSTSVARCWHAGSSTTPPPPPAASSPTRCPPSPARGSTRRVTWGASTPTGTWSSSGGSTTRSRSAATGWSRRGWNAPCARTPRWNRPWCSPTRRPEPCCGPSPSRPTRSGPRSLARRCA
ncbi:AMP-binding protein [Streptomyces sp. UC1A3]